MKKLILIILIICGLAINIFADLPNPPSTEINDGQPLIARPVYNSLFSLYDILNGKINSLNIKLGGINVDRLAGGITPTYLQSPFDINSIIANGNITYAKLNSDIFGGAASVIYNNTYIDLRYNTSIFKKNASNNFDINDSGITGNLLADAIAGDGLSFDTSTPKKLKVNVDTTYLKIDTITNKIDVDTNSLFNVLSGAKNFAPRLFNGTRAIGESLDTVSVSINNSQWFLFKTISCTTQYTEKPYNYPLLFKSNMFVDTNFIFIDGFWGITYGDSINIKFEIYNDSNILVDTIIMYDFYGNDTSIFPTHTLFRYAGSTFAVATSLDWILNLQSYLISGNQVWQVGTTPRLIKIPIGSILINQNNFKIKIYLQRAYSAVGLNWHLSETQILEYY